MVYCFAITVNYKKTKKTKVKLRFSFLYGGGGGRHGGENHYEFIHVFIVRKNLFEVRCFPFHFEEKKPPETFQAPRKMGRIQST